MLDGVRELLNSSQSHERLKAARLLALTAQPHDLTEIHLAFAQESIPWVKRALQIALDRLVPNASQIPNNNQNLESISEAIVRDITLKNGNEIASAFLHEILPKVGFIRNAASNEIANFETSETIKRINALENMLGLMGEYRKISKIPTYVEFDLADLIENVIDEFRHYPILKAGQKSLYVKGEPTRVQLAIANGLRNAIDSSNQLAESLRVPIAINWGVTDTDYWISVVDSGVGLVGNVNGMFKIGSTSKPGGEHYGMGLPLARQAIIALGGNVTLMSGSVSGARYEIKWPRIIEILEGEKDEGSDSRG